MEMMEKIDSIIEFAEKLKNDLKEFDLIFAFLKEEETINDWMNDFCKILLQTNVSKKILIFSDMNICLEDNAGYEWRKLDKNECNLLKSLYTMYDFSDHFFLISKNLQYGSLLNYVKNGMITLEEAVQSYISP